MSDPRTPTAPRTRAGRRRAGRHIAAAALGIAALAGIASEDARAAPQAAATTAQCLAASDASLKFATSHKLRAERAQLILCAAPSCPAAINKECLSHVDEVNAQIPTIVFAARDHAGGNLAAVKVSMDGEVLTEKLDGTALAVDPGEPAFTFEAAGDAPVTRTLIIQEAQKDRHETVTFAAPAADKRLVQAGERTSSPPLGTQRTVALVAGGSPSRGSP